MKVSLALSPQFYNRTYGNGDRESDVGQDIQGLISITQGLECSSTPTGAFDGLVPLNSEVSTLQHKGEEAPDSVE